MRISRWSFSSPLMFAGIFLAAFASRIMRVNGIEMHGDEIWTVWQTFGSAQQVIAWTPYDWGPLFYLLVWLWRLLVGIHPIILRVLSILLFMPGLALMYQIGRISWGKNAGLLAMMVYAALGYVMYSSIELRGYVLMLALMVLAIWLALRYFEEGKILTAVGLALTMTALFYVQATSVIAFALLGMLTLVCFRRAIWRWWLPGLITFGLVAPLLLNRAGTFTRRIMGYNAAALPPITTFLERTWVFDTGFLALLWLGLFILALFMIINQRQNLDRRWMGMLTALLLGTIIYYFSTPIFNSPGSARHAWWLVPFLPLIISFGLAKLPLRGQRVVGGILLLSLAAPLPMKTYYNQPWPNPATSESFAWLTEHLRPGDVVVLDPGFPCYDTPMEWEYYTRVYFPAGLEYVETPGEYQRVWYVAHDSHQTPDLFAEITRNRVPGKFVGPPECLFRLYQAPPDQEGKLFANGMRFHGFELIDTEGDPLPHAGLRPFPIHEGETIRLRLWWSSDNALSADYSIGLHLYDTENVLLVQSDSGPQVVDGPAETSQWESGRIYFEERLLKLPDSIETNHIGVKDLTLYLLVYQWWDNQRFEAPGTDELMRLPLFTLQVKAW
ncbi:MAG: hypothetical protein Kow0077_19620 [Anaerolineae bacterium]